MPGQLMGDLRSIVGDRLRSVIRTDAEGYRIVYVRDDVRTKYTAEEVQRIHDDVVLDGIRKGHLEEMFNAGTCQATSYVLEEAAVFYYPRDEGSGLVVTVDPDCDLPIGEFMLRCRDAL